MSRTCGNCHCVGHNRRTCQRGGATIKTPGEADIVVNIDALIDDINKLISTQEGQCMIELDPKLLFDTVAHDHHIETLEEIEDYVDLGIEVPVWPKEIWAVYYATVLQFKELPELPNYIGNTLKEIYSELMENNFLQKVAPVATESFKTSDLALRGEIVLPSKVLKTMAHILCSTEGEIGGAMDIDLRKQLERNTYHMGMNDRYLLQISKISRLLIILIHLEIPLLSNFLLKQIFYTLITKHTSMENSLLI